MASRKVAGDFRLLKNLLSPQLSASRQISNRLSNAHSIVRREFSLFNDNRTITTLTRNVMNKNVERAMMGAEANAKVKESFVLARNYSTAGEGLKGVKPDDMLKKGETNHVSSLRPLSPHLSIYKPQETSLSSISFRISGIVLVAAVLGFYMVYMKLGLIAFSSESLYLLMFYLAKLVPVSLMLIAVALTYHVYHGVPHIMPWVTRFKKA